MKALPRIPEWIERLAVPAWISGPDERIQYVNARAETLLETRGGCLGRKCHELIAGVVRSGKSFCSRDCPVRRTIASGRPCRPVVLRVRSRWVAVLPLPLGGRDHCPVVHLALDASRNARIEDYLARVADQDGHLSRTAWAARFRGLTGRQQEMLQLLSTDENPKAIARRLHRSVPTIRNHIQRLLGKLGVHSVQQAVALFLLHERGEPGCGAAASPWADECPRPDP